jgi:hypothetical protein
MAAALAAHACLTIRRAATGRRTPSSPGCASTGSPLPRCSTDRSTSDLYAYVEQVLAPALRPGDVVVLDNLAVHKQRV